MVIVSEWQIVIDDKFYEMPPRSPWNLLSLQVAIDLEEYCESFRTLKTIQFRNKKQ